jgi:uncharacterized glyoxalase superfamily protein PhnB
MEQAVTPYLLYEDGEAAIDFLTRAFGFHEIDRATGAAGGLHAELEVEPSGGRVYLGQPSGGFQNPAADLAGVRARRRRRRALRAGESRRGEEDCGAAADWLAAAFGFEELKRIEEDGEVGHVTLRAGDGLIFLGHPSAGYLNPRHLRERFDALARMYEVPWVIDGVWVAVDDLDSHCERARAARARVLTEPEDTPHGCQYRVEDLEGHRWMFQQRA